MRITYEHFQPRTVLYVRRYGPYAQSAREAWNVMGRWLDARKTRSRMRLSFGLFRDNPKTTIPDLIRYDACIPQIDGFGPDEAVGIESQVFGGGAYAVYIHVGAYEEMGGIFSRLHREVAPKRGLVIDYDRPFLATYLTDPTITREMHRRTGIGVPILPLQMSVASNDSSHELVPIVSAFVGT